jgi:DNA-directed RNA polymerase subunit F
MEKNIKPLLFDQNTWGEYNNMVEQPSEKPMSLAEVKNILKKVSKEREELIYEQRIALEHAQKFAKLSIKQTKDMINDLNKLDFIDENQAYKIADLLPVTEDDVRAFFAKERFTPTQEQIKKITTIVNKYYII